MFLQFCFQIQQILKMFHICVFFKHDKHNSTIRILRSKKHHVLLLHVKHCITHHFPGKFRIHFLHIIQSSCVYGFPIIFAILNEFSSCVKQFLLVDHIRFGHHFDCILFGQVGAQMVDTYVNKIGDVVLIRSQK